MWYRTDLVRPLSVLGFACLTFFVASSVHAAEFHFDSDVDGIPDTWEEVVFSTSSTQSDTDGDKIGDRTEIVNGTDPLKKTGKLIEKDFDKDGLSDRLELLFGTDPTNSDTDGDGFLDGTEVESGFSPTSTEAMILPKTIKIILKTQRLEQQVAGIAIHSYVVSTGKWQTPTPVGQYQILNKIPRAWSNMAKLWMPNWMAISKKGYGIHELPEWPGGAKEGANHLGIPVSHGCVRLGIGPAKTMFDWTPIGTSVTVVAR